MKKIILILLIVFFSSRVSNSQSSGWFWQNPLPQGNALSCLKFFDVNNGFCVSSDAVLKTYNGGINWQSIYTPATIANGNLFMVDQSIGYLIADSNRLYKSQNGGLNWDYLTSFDNAKNPLLYFLDPTTGLAVSRLSADNFKGTVLLRTNNGGTSWNTVISDSAFQIYAVNFPNQLTGFAAGTVLRNWSPIYLMRLLKTTNGGMSWDSIPSNVNMDTKTIFFINENTGFAGGYNGSLGKLYKTTNSGNNWVEEISSIFGTPVQIQFIDQNSGFALGNANTFYKSTDGGANWQNINLYNEIGLNDVNSISFTSFSTGYGAGEGGQFVRTTNSGINWTRLSNNSTLTFYTVKFSDNNTGFAGGTNGFIYRTTNAGMNWEIVMHMTSENIVQFEAISNAGNNVWYAADFFSGKVLRTINTGQSWDTLYTNKYGIQEMEFANQNTGYALCKYYYLLKTTNGGLNWTSQNLFWWWSSDALDFIDANTGYTVGMNTLFKTTNGAQSWDSVKIDNLYYASGIQFLNANTGFMSGDLENNSFGLYKTTNGGLNWYTHVFPASMTNSYSLYFLNDITGYVLMYGGLYKTTDGAGNFRPIKTCTSNTLWSLYFADTLNGYCVGNYGTIIKTTTGGEPIGIQPVSNEVPTSFQLYQNYPNPFNPSTVIKFQVAGYKLVKVVIYDILGREVTTLVDEQLKPGTYEVNWNAANYASGVYFYQLTSADFVQTRKMVLLK